MKTLCTLAALMISCAVLTAQQADIQLQTQMPQVGKTLPGSFEQPDKNTVGKKPPVPKPVSYDLEFTEAPFINYTYSSVGYHSQEDRRFGIYSMAPRGEFWSTYDGVDYQGNGQFCFGAAIRNNGSATLTNVKLITRVIRADNGLCNYEKTTSGPASLAAGGTATLEMVFSGSNIYDYTGLQMGQYGKLIIENTLICDQFPYGVDEDQANSRDTVIIDVTEGTYGFDDGDGSTVFNSIEAIPGFMSGSQDGIELGVRFIPSRSFLAKSVNVFVHPDTEPGVVIKAHVYRVNLDAVTDADYWLDIGIESNNYTVQSSDLGQWLRLDMENATGEYDSLESNSEHLVAIEIIGNGNKFYPAKNTSSYTDYFQQSVSICHGHANGGDWAGFSNSTAPVIRLEVCEDCSPSAESIEPDELDISWAVDTPSCFSCADGSLSLSVSGGTTPYSYSWAYGGTGESLGGLAAGDYIVTISDNSSLTTHQRVTVPAPTTVSTPMIDECHVSYPLNGIDALGGYYAKLPMAQATPMDFYTLVTNYGLTSAADLSMGMSITGPGGSNVYSVTCTGCAKTIASTDSDTLFMNAASYFKPTTLGWYHMDFLLFDQTGDTLDVKRHSFELTEDLYARDDGVVTGSVLNREAFSITAEDNDRVHTTYEFYKDSNIVEGFYYHVNEQMETGTQLKFYLSKYVGGPFYFDGSTTNLMENCKFEIKKSDVFRTTI